MADINEWDFAEAFSAVEVALLIEGKDPGEADERGWVDGFGAYVSDVILSRMENDYVATLNYLTLNYLCSPFEDSKYNRGAHLPSATADWYLSAKGATHNGVDFETWRLSDDSDFIVQKFTRDAIQNWLNAKGLPSEYQFARNKTLPVAPGSAPAVRWPWGNHHTEQLGHLEAAARRYWVNYDPSDATTAPINATVSEWLQTERKVSRSMADSIASMLRPTGLAPGPRK